MNKTLIIASIILFFLISGLISFINDLNSEVDVKHGFERTDNSHKSATDYGMNEYGEEVLLLDKFKEKEKKLVWEKSIFHEEMLSFFPQFEEMRQLVHERVKESGTFKERLIERINSVENEYIAGQLDAKSAKKALAHF